jgi:hypothetical protein
MERLLRFSAVCMVVGAVSACSTPDKTITTTVGPTAGVRFINAVPDTAGAFGLDFRFIDIVESNAQFRVGFRNAPTTSGGVTASTNLQYKAALAGARHFVVFLDDTIQSIATTKLIDSTFTFEAGKNYSVVLWGSARPGAANKLKLSIIPEVIADPATQVALRVINATNAPIDVRQYAQGGTLPASATWAAVPPLSASSFVTAAPGNILYNVQPAGGGTALFADQLALQGTAALSSAGAGGKIDTDALPGTTVPGSAVTLIVFPPSTVGARTPQTAAFLVPGGSFVWDRRPPSIF